jgi:hypothetical protein
MKVKNLLLFAAAAALSATAMAQDLKTGEYAVQNDGSPAIIGQCVQDHLFVRNDYDDQGETKTYDNVISFKTGTPQVVAFFLDDREIYNNAEVQALTPVPCTDGGSELYKEITYNSAQFDIYLPMTMSLIKYKFPGEKRAIEAQAGDRLPYDASISWSKKDNTKTIDGIEYNVYTVLITNQKNDACHFSGNEDTYADNEGALMMDDAPLFKLAVENANQAEVEGHLADMIIANQEFGIREANINWGTDPNKCRYIYGTGGNNVEQRFQLYNRVSLYGSSAVVENLAEKTIKSVRYYNIAGMESEVPFEGVNIKVTTYNDGTNSTCKVIK